MGWIDAHYDQIKREITTCPCVPTCKIEIYRKSTKMRVPRRSAMTNSVWGPWPPKTALWSCTWPMQSTLGLSWHSATTCWWTTTMKCVQGFSLALSLLLLAVHHSIQFIKGRQSSRPPRIWMRRPIVTATERRSSPRSLLHSNSNICQAGHRSQQEIFCPVQKNSFSVATTYE